MTRPKGRRGSGFWRPKRGREKRGERGPGSGASGRFSAYEVPVGKIEDDRSSQLSDATDFSAEEGYYKSADNIEVVKTPVLPTIVDHNYYKPSEDVAPVVDTYENEAERLEKGEKEMQRNVLEVVAMLRGLLPKYWIAVADNDGIHVLKLSVGDNKAIQRDIFVDLKGHVKVTVHRRLLSGQLHDNIIKSCPPAVVLSSDTVKQYVDRLMSLTLHVRYFEVCAGQDNDIYKQYWEKDEFGCTDSNVFDESRYLKTFRTHNCDMLLPSNKWVCKECQKAGNRFKHRILSDDINFHPSTKNSLLNSEQAKHKLCLLAKKIKSLSSQHRRVQRALESEGVTLNEDLSEKFTEILKETKLTPLQELFMQQQFKAGSVKNTKGMRWHPTMIRFALLIKSTSSAAYRAMRDAGLISLPGERTLFDYSHALPKQQGCNTGRINILSEKVSQLPEYQQYHNLLMDEMYVSQKLVYSRATGEMIGYVKLDKVTEEMRFLTEKMNSGIENDEPPLATTILTYMEKGLANSVKTVVAAYPTAKLTREDIYEYSWEVITNCEVAGIKILGIVCDGNSVNRAFFQMHRPVTELPSGLVHDSINICAPDRTLYFLSDPPHLLKTIRNCFAKSGIHPKCKIRLTKGRQVIAWKTIERLFLEDHENTWRKGCKLNSMNVYLNSYTCMKVLYAAQVMSKTVSLDLKTRKWPGTSETADFILRVNNFFDCLNEAHSEQGHRTANERLNPYTDVNDPRFTELEEFLDYIKNWQQEIDAIPFISTKEKQKFFLPQQTVDGIELTIRSFIAAVKFMLSIPTERNIYLNARVFCQDPLEQYFGKQRARLGGSNNPNPDQYFDSDNLIDLHRDLNVRRRSGNTEATVKAMDITEEALPKRRKTK